MSINTQIPQTEWSEFFVAFSNGNQGREVTLEVFSVEEGAEGQARQGKLLALDYDSPEKGNRLMLTTGEGEVEYSHTVDAPVEVMRAQEDDGEIEALEIIDQQGVRTILSLK
ncbi:DUF5335 domain-containing protein [Blastopirellula sp. JC732]|uniref:DUF5335 domain-containing protein n=1 Tax=Blastopirellula sediminis TaxID=2894196 RepID=A0A9X1SGJ7_9BACT|nr:DUF5335 family protein [Blastopirellula sediminis]MCC9608457.1 DUF5335 domain-containing protein [Blastopirellula sediminis]MCC9628766.1 DUF5335 domain-containing protein [Blastopirellula sediminis]